MTRHVRAEQGRSALDIARAIAAGETTAERVAGDLLARVEAAEPSVQAFAHLDPDAFLAAARASDAGGAGLLRGVPFAVKDNIDTHDMPTAHGTPIHAGKTPGRDAACVALMRLAGAVLMGKTVTTELAHRHPGKTRNPWNPAHTPGGSSSGSAAAVAAGMVPVAFGTQTTGSVIRPAAYCGVVGYKPTHGDLNVSGVLENTPSFDTLGIMARTVDDTALARAALLDGRFARPRRCDLAGLRIAVCRTPYWDRADDETRGLLEDTAAELSRRGARVVDLDDAGALEDIDDLARTVSGYEFARSLAHERLYALDQLSAILRENRMADGLVIDHEDYRTAMAALELARIAFDAAMARHDVALTPSAPGTAPAGLHSTGDAVFNLPWTTLHVPAVTLPAGSGTNGLPLGVQLVAPRGADRRLLEVAASLEPVLAARG